MVKTKMKIYQKTWKATYIEAKFKKNILLSNLKVIL